MTLKYVVKVIILNNFFSYMLPSPDFSFKVIHENVFDSVYRISLTAMVPYYIFPVLTVTYTYNVLSF